MKSTKIMFDLLTCFLLGAVLFTGVPAFAQDETGEADQTEETEETEDLTAPPPIPPIPPKIAGEEVEPSVRIRQEEDNLVEEYSRDGQIYMVKVTPAKGKPYFYLDEDGDGQLELQPGDQAMNPVRPVFWKLKEWK